MLPSLFSFLLLSILVFYNSISNTAADRNPAEDTLLDILEGSDLKDESSSGLFSHNNQSDFSIFTNLLLLAGLGEIYAEEGNGFTIFAPDDAAFKQTADDLGILSGSTETEVYRDMFIYMSQTYADPIAALTLLLKFHILPGKWRVLAEDPTGLGMEQLDAMLNARGIIRANMILIDIQRALPDANIIYERSNMEVSNSIIHVIDRVAFFAAMPVPVLQEASPGPFESPEPSEDSDIQFQPSQNPIEEPFENEATTKPSVYPTPYPTITTYSILPSPALSQTPETDGVLPSPQGNHLEPSTPQTPTSDYLPQATEDELLEPIIFGFTPYPTDTTYSILPSSTLSQTPDTYDALPSPEGNPLGPTITHTPSSDYLPQSTEEGMLEPIIFVSPSNQALITGEQDIPGEISDVQPEENDGTLPISIVPTPSNIENSIPPPSQPSNGPNATESPNPEASTPPGIDNEEELGTIRTVEPSQGTIFNPKISADIGPVPLNSPQTGPLPFEDLFDPNNLDTTPEYNGLLIYPSWEPSMGPSMEPSMEPSMVFPLTSESSEESLEGACFPVSAFVHLPGSATVPIVELEAGQAILATESISSPVYLFTHRQFTGLHDFVRIISDGNHNITLSQGHYLYANGELKIAGNVEVGDKLRTLDGDAIVTSVEWTKDHGFIAPHTMHGDIVVNRVVASTYTSALHPKIAHSILWPLRLIVQLGLMKEPMGGLLYNGVRDILPSVSRLKRAWKACRADRG